MPVVSPKATRSAPSATTRATMPRHPLRVDVPLVRAAEAGGDDDLDARPGAVQHRDQLGDVVERLVGATRLTLRRLCVSLAETTTSISVKPAASARCAPREFGTSAE